METDLRHRRAALGILATWCAYVAFALLTDWEDYGLTARAEHRQTWIVGRVATVSAWLFLATILLLYRKHSIDWRSFSYAAIATSLSAIVVAPALVSQNANHAVIAGSVVFYALVSGFLCIRLKNPRIAGVLGVILLPAQLFVDASTHVLAGVFRIH